MPALHQLTIPNTDPIEFIKIARQVGCDRACVFANWPLDVLPSLEVTQYIYPAINNDRKRDISATLKNEGVSLVNIEFFPIVADLDLETYRPALELGAELGARRAVTHIFDPDEARSTDNLAKFCSLAAEYGLKVGLEFMGLSPPCGSIHAGLGFVNRVGHSGLGIGIDALHLVRTGGRPADVAAIAPEQIAYAQICDGFGLHVSADYLDEGMHRVLPGKGDFPLVEFLRAMPKSVDVDMEVPSTELRKLNISPADHARQVVEATQPILKSGGWL